MKIKKKIKATQHKIIPYGSFVWKLIYSIFSLFNLIFPRRKKNTSNLDLIVISPGGVATTSFLHYFETLLKTNSKTNADGIKHSFSIPIIEDKTKILFMYSKSTRRVIKYLKFKNYYLLHSYYMSSPLSILFDNQKIGEYFFKKRMRQQIKNFVDSENKNVLCLAYPDFFYKKNKIKKFLNLTDKQLVNFPKYSKRKGRINENKYKYNKQTLSHF